MASLVVLASGGSVLIGFIIVAVPYFAPSIVAFVRHHHNQWAIFALNLLLGWTVRVDRRAGVVAHTANPTTSHRARVSRPDSATGGAADRDVARKGQASHDRSGEPTRPVRFERTTGRFEVCCSIP